MYVGLKQPRGDGERYVTPARAAAKETSHTVAMVSYCVKKMITVFSPMLGQDFF